MSQLLCRINGHVYFDKSHSSGKKEPPGSYDIHTKCEGRFCCEVTRKQSISRVEIFYCWVTLIS